MTISTPTLLEKAASDGEALPPLLTVAQFSDFIGWSEKSVRHRIGRGQIPDYCVARVGRSVYLVRDKVLRLVLEGRGPSPRGSR